MMRFRYPFLPAAVFLAAFVPSTAATADEGQDAFTEQNCHKCHSVASVEIEATVKSEKMRGPDLSEVEKAREADWVKQYLLKEVQLNDKDHKAKWKGSEKTLQMIADWVAALK